MPSRRFSKYLPTAQRLKENRFLKPFARYLHHHFLWQFNRRGVAGGVAVGLFFGLLIPFAQILLAAVAAILVRVNLPAAALCTLVSNPLTFPPIYYLAYRLGDALTGGSAPVPPAGAIEADIEHVVAVQQGEVTGWFPHLLDWMQSVGLPLALGLSVLATTSAVLGYVVVNAAWKAQVRWHWRRRCRARALGR